MRVQGPKPADRLAKGEPEGTEYDYESKVDFAVFPSLQVRHRDAGSSRQRQAVHQ